MNFYDVLAAEKWGGGIPTMNFFDWIFAQSISGEQWQVYEGTLPATINANGSDMRQYQVWGNIGGVGEEVDITGLSEPLCGIGAYTDSLNLSTGILTRRIKKLVLTGNEKFTKNDNLATDYLYYAGRVAFLPSSISKTPIVCSHLLAVIGAPQGGGTGINTSNDFNVVYINFGADIMNAQASGNTVNGLKKYLAAQYAAGTPVTIWYVLEEPEVSTIPIPSGLTGTLEGYLIHDGTPTPETPIYPTANGEKQADDTYSIKYGYKLNMASRTRNLFDISSITHEVIDASGAKGIESGMDLSGFIEVDGEYTVSWKAIRVGAYMRVSTFDENKNFIERVTALNTYTNTHYTNSHTGYIRINYENEYGLSDIMLNTGSNALPYEPYSDTTTTIYISDSPLDKDEYVDYQAGKVYRINNLWNITAEDFENSSIISGAAKGYIVNGLKPNTMYTLSSNIPRGAYAANLWFNGSSTTINGVWNGNSRTSISNRNGEATVYYRTTALNGYGQYWYRLIETNDPYLPPTDPPVPLPALPTCEGTTIVDYAGSGTAPEKVYFEYQGGE